MTTFAHLTLLALAIVSVGCGDGADGRGDSMSGGSTSDNAVFYEETPEAIASGQRIFESQTCVRCHKPAGQAGLGPTLTDAEWVYGGEPEEIFESIMNGRPRGMAPYSGRLSVQEVWHLVAYLRSTSGAGR
jgi:mono/diheme cytochrome c family protein